MKFNTNCWNDFWSELGKIIKLYSFFLLDLSIVDYVHKWVLFDIEMGIMLDMKQTRHFSYQRYAILQIIGNSISLKYLYTLFILLDSSIADNP